MVVASRNHAKRHGVARNRVEVPRDRAVDRNTTTRAGLRIRAELDTDQYPTGISVTDAEVAALNLTRADFHGDWNYTLLPFRRAK
jgi:hypothetical protein